MITLSKAQVLRLHSQLIKEIGGTDGIRDEGLLDSALHAPFQFFDGFDVYPSLQQKAARLGYGLAKNHPFPKESLIHSAPCLCVSALSSRRPIILSVTSATPMVCLLERQRIHVNPEQFI